MYRLLAIVIVLLAIGVIYFNFVNKSVPTSIKTQASIVNEDNIPQRYILKIQYPQIVDQNSSTAKINADLNATVNSKIDDFKKQVKQNLSNPNIPNLKSELDISYQVKQANSKILSGQFIISEMVAGFAHPNTYNQTFNYDITNGSKIYLSNIFNDNADYLNVLSEICQKNLISQFQPSFKGETDEEKFAAMDWIKQGTAPKSDNYKNFMLSSTDLIIVFNTYQVGSRPDGISYVNTPLSNLKSILSPNYQ